MSESKKIFTECFADTQLLYSLGFEKNRIEHSLSKPKIADKLKKYLNRGIYLDSLAVIDEDPDPEKTSHPFFKNFKEMYIDKQLNIKIINYKDFWILVICPYLEEWLIKTSKRNKIDIKTFNLSDKPKELHQITASMTIPKSFVDFLSKLIKTKDLIKITKILSNPSDYIRNASQPS